MTAADPFLPETWLEFPPDAPRHLASADARMGALVERCWPLRRRACPGAFAGLLYAIASQQISGKARDAIWHRLVVACAPLAPVTFAALDVEKIRACGLSARKAQYMLALARAFASGDLTEEKLARMADAELAATLSHLPGIGLWTVEMALIFTFQRQNVISFGDLGIRKGICRLYDLPGLTRPAFDALAARYAPYASLASLLLWELAGAPALRI